MKYIEQTTTPYQYYLNTLKAAIYSMANGNKERTEQIYQIRLKDIEELNSDLPSAQIAPNHPDRLIRTADYVSEFVFQDALILQQSETKKFDVTPAIGVEFYSYDFDHSHTKPNFPYYRNYDEGCYAEVTNELWQLFATQQSSIKRFTKPDSNNIYNVVNFKEISSELKSLVKSYYTSNRGLIGNLSPDTDLQKRFRKFVGEIQSQIIPEKINRTSFNY